MAGIFRKNCSLQGASVSLTMSGCSNHIILYMYRRIFRLERGECSVLSEFLNFKSLVFTSDQTNPPLRRGSETIEDNERGRGFEAGSSDTLLDHNSGPNYGTTIPPRSSSPTFSEASMDSCQYFTDLNDNKDVTLRSVLKSKNMKLIIANFICFAFTERCYYDLTPLFYSTSIETGGLGLSPYHIGLIMSIWGFCNAFFQINVVGRLIRSYGGASVYKFGYVCYLLSLLTFPLSACLARGNGSVGFGAWTVILIQLFFQFFSYMSYSSYYHLLVHISLLTT